MVIKGDSDSMSELTSQMTTEFTEISKYSLKKADEHKGKIEKSKGVLLGHHWKRLPWIAYRKIPKISPSMYKPLQI